MDILKLPIKMTKKRQILFIHQNFPGQFKSLAPGLIKKGYEVHALGEMNSISQVNEFPGLNLHSYEITKGSTKGIDSLAVEFESKMIRAQFALAKCEELKKNGLNPSVIIAHPQWGESFFLNDLWPESKILSYFEFHWNTVNSDIDFDKEFYDDEYFKFTVKKIRARNVFNYEIFNHSDQILSPTEYQKNTAPEIYRKNISVIHDGIDTKTLKPNNGVEVMLEKNLKLSKKDKIITFINRNLEPQRGYHIFMRSLPDILKKHPDAHVFIIGGDGKGYGMPPPAKSTWKNIFFNEVEKDIDVSKIHFLGSVEYKSLISLYQISSVHVYLTYPFVLSWSLLEAMSCECLIVGSSTEPVKEVINDKKNGLLVNFFDQKELSETINKVLENPKKFDKLRKAARDTIIRKYDLKTICLPKQIDLVEKLLLK